VDGGGADEGAGLRYADDDDDDVPPLFPLPVLVLLLLVLALLLNELLEDDDVPFVLLLLLLLLPLLLSPLAIRSAVDNKVSTPGKGYKCRLFLKNLTARSYCACFNALAPIVLHFSASPLFTSIVKKVLT
jgi:hypothetical protein